MFRTLIGDLDGLYDPTSYNDRLLLGPQGERITGQVGRIWLSRFGLHSSRKPPAIENADSEWTLPQIVQQYQVPVATPQGWIWQGQVQARQVGGRGGRWIVIATSSELALLLNNRRSPGKSAD